MIVMLCFGFVLLMTDLSLGYKRFNADVVIFNDPRIHGVMKGRINYDWDAKMMRIDYQGGDPIEIFDWNTNVRYLLCSDGGNLCQSESINYNMPAFFFDPADPQISPPPDPPNAGLLPTPRGHPYSKPSSTGLDRLWIGEPFKNPVWAEFTSGKIFCFLNIRGGSTDSSLTEFTTWGCVQKQCISPVDIMLVMDVSGSISPPDFELMRQWALDLTSFYEISVESAHIGWVTFSEDAMTVLNLDFRSDNVRNSLTNYHFNGNGATCIGCGINNAVQSFLDFSRRRDIPKIIILLSDGINNRPLANDPEDEWCFVCPSRADQHLADAVERGTQAGISFFTIGVGDQVSTTELESIASSSNQFFHVQAGFSALGTTLDQLQQETCSELPGNPCGFFCGGFCYCSGQCRCPNSCDYGDKCALSSCSGSAPFTCSTPQPKNCIDSNLCTTNERCDPTTGTCLTDPTSCGTDPCMNNFCLANVGCVTYGKKCPDSTDPCIENYCDAGTCKSRPQSCDRCDGVTCPIIPCQTNECDPADGQCRITGQKQCIPTSKCATGQCNPTTGQCGFTPKVCNAPDLCTTSSCDPMTGQCVNTPIKCDDTNLCTTNDTCAPSTGLCSGTPVPTPCGDDLCMIYQCDPATGCTTTGKKCPDSTDPCIENYCDAGTCKSRAKACDKCQGVTCPPIPCKENQCDPSTGACSISANTLCLSSNPCIIGMCNPSTDQCEFSRKNCASTFCITIMVSAKLFPKHAMITTHARLIRVILSLGTAFLLRFQCLVELIPALFMDVTTSQVAFQQERTSVGALMMLIANLLATAYLSAIPILVNVKATQRYVMTTVLAQSIPVILPLVSAYILLLQCLVEVTLVSFTNVTTLVVASPLGKTSVGVPLMQSALYPENVCSVNAIPLLGNVISLRYSVLHRICTTSACDVNTGLCNSYPKACDDNDACTTDSCDPSTGDCLFTPLAMPCGSDPCFIYECDSIMGCFSTGENICGCTIGGGQCQSSSKCVTAECNISTSRCEFTPACISPDQCTTSFCVELTGNCTTHPKIDCDDDNPCTTDSCDPNTGECTFAPITDLCSHLDTLCTEYVCRTTFNGTHWNPGCHIGSYTDCDSHPELQPVGSCAYTECILEQGGCLRRELPNVSINKCGDCEKEGKFCILDEDVAVIGSATLVIFIIGTIIGIVCCVTSSGTAFGIMKKYKGSMGTVFTNPLFKESSVLAGENPLYDIATNLQTQDP